MKDNDKFINSYRESARKRYPLFSRLLLVIFDFVWLGVCVSFIVHFDHKLMSALFGILTLWGAKETVFSLNVLTDNISKRRYLNKQLLSLMKADGLKDLKVESVSVEFDSELDSEDNK